MQTTTTTTTTTCSRFYYLQLLVCTIPLLVLDGIRLGLFVLLLLPAFLRFAWFYFIGSDRQVTRYSDASCRCFLDIYGEDVKEKKKKKNKSKQNNDSTATNTKLLEDPLLIHTNNNNKKKKPVLVFFTGGAWTIGYKMWGALLARALVPLGVLVVIPDYRNYPTATVPDMIQDVDCAMEWILNNIESYGGDSNNIVLAGQSAGGHLCATSILRQLLFAMDNNNNNNNNNNNYSSSSFSFSSRIKGLVLISSPLNIESMEYAFCKHGISKETVQAIFNNRIDSYNPHSVVSKIIEKRKIWQAATAAAAATTAVDQLSEEKKDDYPWQGKRMCHFDAAAVRFPKIHLFHGTADKTVPYTCSQDFCSMLQNYKDFLQIDSIGYTAYEGWTHTDPILEGPMGGDERLHLDIYNLMINWTTPECNFRQAKLDTSSYLCPSVFVKLARWVNPF